MSRPLFPTGEVVATPGAIELMEEAGVTPLELLAKHVSLDRGTLCEEDWKLNFISVRDGMRVLTAFEVGGEKLWLITEADRSSTCFLLASEY